MRNRATVGVMLATLMLACSSTPDNGSVGPVDAEGVVGVDVAATARTDARTVTSDAGMDGGHAGCGLVTCASAHANCGSIGDGCSGVLQCGTCVAPATCGGGGQPSQCGGTTGCVPRTCADAGANCGPISDGCGSVVECGTCAAGESCGVVHPNVCTGTTGPTGTGTCTGLCLRRATCTGGVTTTISGTVVSPALVSPDPLYDAVVYIPNAAVQPFSHGVSCDRCGTPASGSPLVSAITGPDGRFTLTDVPVGANIPLVVQLGRWRRQVTLANVNPCVDNPLSADLTRLPRSQSEGDIPLMAMVTGSADPLECVLLKMGINPSEFTTPSGGGRVQFYVANGATLGGSTPAASVLTSSPATLADYDMVLFACEGRPIDKPMGDLTNVVNYTNLGGRVFSTHFSYTWLYTIPPFSGTARWNVNQRQPTDPLPGIIDTSFPRGMAFAQWLQIVGASPTPGQISISQPRHDVDGVIAPTARWIYSTTPATLQPLTFNTPVGADPATQCGRVLYSDFHVNATGSGSHSGGGRMFPTECDTNPLTPQERVLEFMLFDLSSCIAPDAHPVTTCIPATCASTGVQCGPIGDGCGGVVQCGTCPFGLACGYAGHPNTCGHGSCTPRTCASVGALCGPIGDGCGAIVQCGPCPAGQACGGGGVANHCGSPG